MRVRLPVALAVVAFLLLAVVAARGSSGIPTGVVDLGPGIAPGAGGGGPANLPSVTDDPVFASSAGVLVVLVLVGALFGLAVVLTALGGVRLRRRRRTRAPDVVADAVVDGVEPWLVRAGQRALLELDRRIGGPPSDAVIAAWVQLERSAAETGVERQAHQTPTEFTSAVLAERNADEEALTTLRKLYHQARFGRPGAVTADDAQLARRALERIA